MHIPPYLRKKSWQRFFLGFATGAVIAYVLFIFMYGSMYERLFENNLSLQSKVSELESQNKALSEDKKAVDEENKERLTVERIEIVIANADKLQLDRLIIHQLDDMIKNEINHIIGNDIRTVAESVKLLQSTIQNKEFSIDDFTYYFEVETMTISNTVELTLLAKISS